MKIALIFLSTLLSSLAHPIEFHNDPFRQLEEVWPTPTENSIVFVCRVRPSCFPAENPLWLVGAPVRLAASLRLLAREGDSRNLHDCLFFSRDPLAAGRSAGPLCGVATLAGPREDLSLCIYCFHRVFRERWVAGRSAGPLSGVASLAGPPAVLWFFQALGARDRTHASGGSVDLAG